MKYICGIDPGFTGGIAIIDTDGHIAELEMMPIFDGKDKALDELTIQKLLEQYNIKHLYIEKAQSMPNQSSTAGFNYGVGYGALKAIIKLMRIPYTEVRPMKWKTALSIKTGSKMTVTQKKAEHFKRIAQLYPDLKLLKKEDGLADALLIARHGLKEGM